MSDNDQKNSDAALDTSSTTSTVSEAPVSEVVALQEGFDKDSVKPVTHAEFIGFLAMLSHDARENLTYELAKIRAGYQNAEFAMKKQLKDYRLDKDEVNDVLQTEKIWAHLQAVKELAGPKPPEDTSKDGAIQAGV